MIQQDSTKVTFNEVYSDIKGALSAAGEALKVGSEHVYEVLVRQQAVNSVSMICTDTVILLAAFILFKIATKMAKDDEVEDDLPFPFFIGSIVLFMLGAIAITFDMNDIITGFVNPEYGAIMDIKDFIK